MTQSRWWIAAGVCTLALGLGTARADSPPVKKSPAQKQACCCCCDQPAAGCTECKAAKQTAGAKGCCDQKNDAGNQASPNALFCLTFPDCCLEFCLGGGGCLPCPEAAYFHPAGCAECAECGHGTVKKQVAQATRAATLAPTTAEVGIQKALERIANLLETLLDLATSDVDVAVAPCPPPYFTPAAPCPTTCAVAAVTQVTPPLPAPALPTPIVGPRPVALDYSFPVPPPPTAALPYGTVMPNPVPQTYTFNVLTPSQPVSYVRAPVVAEAARRPEATWGVRVVTEEGKACLELTARGAPEVRGEQFTLKLADGQTVRVRVGEKQVRVSTAELNAVADHVGTSAVGDGIVLSGHVELTFHKEGRQHQATIAAERVTFGLKAGTLACEMK